MSEGRRRFAVDYYAGAYSGTRVVLARDAAEAVEIVRAWVRRQMSSPMYADGYEARECDG